MATETRKQRWQRYAEKRVLHWLTRRAAATEAGQRSIVEKCQRKAQGWLRRLDVAQYGRAK